MGHVYLSLSFGGTSKLTPISALLTCTPASSEKWFSTLHIVSIMLLLNLLARVILTEARWYLKTSLHLLEDQDY